MDSNETAVQVKLTNAVAQNKEEVVVAGGGKTVLSIGC